VELDPNLASAWADLGMLQARLGRWEEADRCFERALDIDPDHGPFLAMWGEAMVQRGRSQEGVALLQRALEKDPHLIRAHEMLARAKKDLGDEGGFHEEMASFHEKMDQYTEAMKHLRLAKKAYGEKTPKGEEIQRRIEELKSS
jgi:predicted Zn-dependent protease